MTKSWESGDSEIVDYVKQEAAQTGRAIEAILAELLAEAKKEKDTKKRLDVQQAQKFPKKRNQRKRRGKR